MTALLVRDESLHDELTAADSTVRWRLRHAAICAVLVALAFNSSSGRMSSDTKIDLTIDPIAFLGRALHLWDPQGFSGQVQDQAYGYLFPMGPFFAVGHLAGFPGWVTERLWWSAMLVTAYTGIVALTRRLEIGTPLAGAVAGIAYAASPHVLTVLGPVSFEALPMCLTPWAIVPLVTGLRTGAHRRAAMRSGLAVLCMGSVNATVVIAAMAPVALFLVAAGGPVPVAVRVRLIAWWAGAVALATAWWVVPLLLLGRYSPPFLDHIESASTTTSVTSLVESLRGTADWFAYVPGSGTQAGQLLLTVPAMVLMSAAVVAAGLAGLADRAMLQRGWLIGTLLLGVLVLTAGHSATVASPFAASERALLDGPLAALRNVHKFDVDIRLPLVLGLAQLVGRAQRLLRGASAAVDVVRQVSAAVLIGVVAAAVAATAAPLVSLHVARATTFGDIPGYWYQAAHWLGRHDSRGRVLLLPATQNESYLWGQLTDNPLQPLAQSAWTERNAAPLIPPGGVRALDAVSERLASGEGSPGLAAFLRSAGIDYLLVRNDLDPDEIGQVRPPLVAQALAGSPGLHRSAAFGPLIDTQGPFVRDQNLRRPVRVLQLWHVDAGTVARSGDSPGAADPEIRAVATASIPRVTGGPESLLDLDDAGLDAGTSVLSPQTTSALHPGWALVTDGLRRRAMSFGAVVDNASQIQTAHTRPTFDRPVEDYQMFGGRDDAVARYLGVRDVRASSSAADATTTPTVPAQQPYAAVDGDPATYWRPAPLVRPVGQWLQLDLASARRVDAVTLTRAPGSPALSVSVRTDAGHAAAVLSSDRAHPVPLPGGLTRRVRVTITAVHGFGGDVGIAELRVPGVRVTKTVVVPAELPSGTRVAAYSFATPADERNGCVSYGAKALCAAGLAQQDEEAAALDRTFTAPSSGTYQVSASVLPRAGPALDAVLARGAAIRASASSQTVSDPRGSPQAAVDATAGTGWVAAATDPHPTLRLSWTGRRLVSSLRIVVDPTLAATAPTSVLVSTPTGSVQVPVGSGTVRFPAVRTDRIALTFSAPALQTSYQPLVALGIGVSEVTVDGVPDESAELQDAQAVQLPCAALPAVRLDGRIVRVEASTTVGALRALQPVTVTPCSADTLSLSPGRHRLQARSTAAWRVQRVSLTSPAPAMRTVAVRRVTWTPTSRAVHLGARSSSTALVIAENVNPGWQATLHGTRLHAVTINGWEQGFVVPAGPAGTVRLRYAPDHVYRLALLVGVLGVLVLLVAVAVPVRRRKAVVVHAARRRRFSAPGVGVAAVGAVALTAVAGPVGLGIALAADALAVIVVATTRGRPERRRSVAAGWAGSAAGSYLLAGLALAVHPYGSIGYRSDSPVKQVLTVAALALLAAAGLLAADPERAGEGASPAPPRTGSSVPTRPPRRRR